MNHVIHHSPNRNVFKPCFAIFMLVATMIITYHHCGNSADMEIGEEIEQHDAYVQSGDIAEVHEELSQVTIWRPMRILTSRPSLHDGAPILLKQNAESELEEHEDIKEEETVTETTETETVVQERESTLYYMNENGWKTYLEIPYQDYLWEMCIKYDVKEYYTLFIAQMYHESGFDPNVISATNDHGLMQINICNHDNLEAMFGFTDFLDPYVSIESGVYFMSEFLHKYNDVEKALVCYNRGESAVINGTYSTSYSQGVLYDMNFLVELD